MLSSLQNREECTLQTWSGHNQSGIRYWNWWWQNITVLAPKTQKHLVNTFCNPWGFFGHIQTNERLKNQVVTLKDENVIRVTDPSSQANIFAEAIHRTCRPEEPVDDPFPSKNHNGSLSGCALPTSLRGTWYLLTPTRQPALMDLTPRFFEP